MVAREGGGPDRHRGGEAQMATTVVGGAHQARASQHDQQPRRGVNERQHQHQRLLRPHRQHENGLVLRQSIHLKVSCSRGGVFRSVSGSGWRSLGSSGMEGQQPEFGVSDQE